MKNRSNRFTVCLLLACSVLVGGLQAQNLIANPGFEAGYADFSSDYGLWPGGPGIGHDTYVVTNNPHNIEATWGSFGDHTSGSGKMLVLDGSTTAGKVLWRQTVPVVANTTYLFSAWTLKFDSLNPPILYFTVNGIQVGTYNVLPWTQRGWQAYGATWNSASATTALLELRLQSTLGPNANNLAADDLSFAKLAELPAPLALAESAIQISWPSDAGASYQVQWASVLDMNTWINLGLPAIGNGTTNIVSDQLSGRERRFYRILQPE